MSLMSAALPWLLRWYGPAKTSWSVSARIAGPRSSGAITRPFESRLSGATSDKLRQGDGPPISSGLKNGVNSGFVQSPTVRRQRGDATIDKRSRLRAEARPGHRTVRLAAKIGAASNIAPAVPRTCQKLNPVRAANVTMLTIQRNLSGAGERISAIPAKAIAAIGNPYTARTFSGKICSILANETASATLWTHNDTTIGSRCEKGDAMHPENEERNAPAKTTENAAPLIARMRNVEW